MPKTSGNKNNAINKILAVANIIILSGLMTVMVACDDKPKDEKKPDTCKCAPGTEHNEGSECADYGKDGCECKIILNCKCEGTKKMHLIGESQDCRGPLNCDCEKNIPGARLSNGVPVILDGEVAITATAAATKIENVFDYIESWGEEYAEYANCIKNNTKVIRVVSDTLNMGPDIIKGEDGKLAITINDGTLNDEGYLDIIGGEFYGFALENMPE